MTELTFDGARIVNDGGVWLCLKVKDPAPARAFVYSFKGVHTAILKRFQKKRSLDANAYFHLLVGKIAEALRRGFEDVKTDLVVEYGTVERDGEGAKIGFKLPSKVDVTKIYRYVKCFDTRVENGVEFNCYIVYKHTHLMDNAEMSRLIEGTVQEAKQLGIETLTPVELARLKEEWGCTK